MAHTVTGGEWVTVRHYDQLAFDEHGRMVILESPDRMGILAPWNVTDFRVWGNTITSEAVTDPVTDRDGACHHQPE